MLGTLTRYLRFMGYDTMSANSLTPGSTREDTLLLAIAARDGRLLLTRDRELARRGEAQAVYIASEEIMDRARDPYEPLFALQHASPARHRAGGP